MPEGILSISKNKGGADVKHIIKYFFFSNSDHPGDRVGAEDMPVHSIVTGVYKANHNRNDTLSSDLLNTFFAISCGVTGIFLLRKAS